ncbi:hypothetical protein BES08_10905 [Novosphingobium resinovorum]|uniref:Uncharacterized protein n=2 Tax=Novosphingobium resinovorum TaxID=158500 RepID=A0A1D8A515_9SPHN|nr:hypothetical protein BES08_10905 [Novosphingobium resinovorum]
MKRDALRHDRWLASAALLADVQVSPLFDAITAMRGCKTSEIEEVDHRGAAADMMKPEMLRPSRGAASAESDQRIREMIREEIIDFAVMQGGASEVMRERIRGWITADWDRFRISSASRGMGA